MTTIAYRDGVLAADRLCTVGTHRDAWVPKIRKRGPILACGCGTWPVVLTFLDWFSDGMPADRQPTMTGHCAKEDGSSGFLFLPDGRFLHLSPSGWSWKRAPFYALGSGADYCYGAFSMGATAEEAVRAALVHETASGGPIDVLRH